ncbi:hypothetical protein ATE84_2233 [Aquimarina sp. MAR_2010_214]|uniref:hypothetical protein n=1 Tax=Aquimarina sp. MAR_2010_214 TaxID=1250026 RepID=UPI000C706F01|nr:hypothetical protein [Aquimarina sp. MAR_2010_214]PKV50183.1 hypothetical protein ATE84_2233 [Aquimarina sp. MAR_2010_214]
MKTLKYTVGLSILSVLLFWNCNDDDTVDFLDNIDAPSNISALVQTTQDNSGLVTIIPNGDAVEFFTIHFGDDTKEPVKVNLGENITHIYADGTYTLKLVGTGITGLKTEVTQDVVVSFKAPENLVPKITINPGDTFTINVSATADYATKFEVHFGDIPNETPTELMVDSTISHTYQTTGNKEIRIVAFSSGPVTTEVTETILIANPLVLPIDFESTSLNYTYIDFGGATGSVVANPNISTINTSATVGRFFKQNGSEVWAGTALQLDDPIIFSSLNSIKINTWSPSSGITVKMKLENATDPDTAIEVDVINTVANGWETLVFNFGALDLSKEYHKIVLFFDFGNSGNDDTYYFDNIELVPLPIEDFEGTPPTFTVFGNIADITVESNPNTGGINSTATAAKLTKTSGSETWAGALFEVSPLDLTSYNKIRVLTYSPTSGVVIKLKLENADASITHEVDITNTITNDWEELIYDFSDAPAADYVKIVIFFDFGNSGTGTEYYYDGIELRN